MEDRIFNNQGRPWIVRLRRLLYAVLLLSFQTGHILSFNHNTRQDTTSLLLHATIDDSPPIDNNQSKGSTHIVFPGGGIFFYYQAGMVNFLREKYDLSACTFSGASAGALTATLTAANVDFFEATDLALRLAGDAGVWDRKGGLQGIWGPMIEKWLDELLPSTTDFANDRIQLLITPVPFLNQKNKISRFENREELIQCNMASVHLPWFLDGKLTSNFRGEAHIDGSFLSKEEDYLPNFDRKRDSTIDVIVLDWSKDPEMSSKGGIDIVEALSPDGIYGLLERGKQYGQVLDDQGVFKNLEKLA